MRVRPELEDALGDWIRSQSRRAEVDGQPAWVTPLQPGDIDGWLRSHGAIVSYSTMVVLFHRLGWLWSADSGTWYRPAALDDPQPRRKRDRVARALELTAARGRVNGSPAQIVANSAEGLARLAFGPDADRRDVGLVERVLAEQGWQRYSGGQRLYRAVPADPPPPPQRSRLARWLGWLT